MPAAFHGALRPISATARTAAIRRIAQFYEAWDNPDQAAEWRARLPKESTGG